MRAPTIFTYFNEASLPPGTFQEFTGWPQDISEEMITNKSIDVIAFTGGVPVGEMISCQQKNNLPVHLAGAIFV